MCILVPECSKEYFKNIVVDPHCPTIQISSSRNCVKPGGVAIWQHLALYAIAGGSFFQVGVENHFNISNSTVDNTYKKIPAENNIFGKDWSKLNLVLRART